MLCSILGSSAEDASYNSFIFEIVHNVAAIEACHVHVNKY